MHYIWCLKRVDMEGDYILPEDKTELTIGRGKENDMKCLSLFVSRNHCKILMNDGLKMFDLGSSNGTFINKQRILREREIPLEDGDVIGIGTTEPTDKDCFIYKLIKISIEEEEPQVNCKASTSRTCHQSAGEATSIRHYKKGTSCENTVCENSTRKRLREDSDSDSDGTTKFPRLIVQSIGNSNSEQQNSLCSAVPQLDINDRSTPQLDVPSKEASSSKQKKSSNSFLNCDIFQISSGEESDASRYANEGDQVSKLVESDSVNVTVMKNENTLLANCTAEPPHRKELSDSLQERSLPSVARDMDNRCSGSDTHSVDRHVNEPSVISSEYKAAKSLKRDPDSEINRPPEISAERGNITSEEVIPNATFSTTIMNTKIKMGDGLNHSALDNSPIEETSHSASIFKNNAANQSVKTPSTTSKEIENDIIILSDSEDEILEERLKRVLDSQENNPQTNTMDQSMKLNHSHSNELDIKKDVHNRQQDNLENIDSAEENLNKKLTSFSSTAPAQEKAKDMQSLNASSLQLCEDRKIFEAKPVVMLERIDAVIPTTSEIKQEETLSNYSMTEENIIELDEDDEFPCSQMFEEAVVIKSEPKDDDSDHDHDDGEEEEKIEMKPFIRCPYDDDDIICINDDSDESDNEWFAKLSQQETEFVDIAQSAVASKSSLSKIEEQEEEENILNAEESLSCVQSKADDFERSDALSNKQHDTVKSKKIYGKPEIIEAIPMPPRRAHQRGISANEAQRIYGEQIDQKGSKEQVEHKSAKAKHKADADKKKTKAESSRDAGRKHSTEEQSAELSKKKPPGKRKQRTNSAPAHISGSDKKKIADKRKELLKAISQKQTVLEKNDIANSSSRSTAVKSNAEVRIKITEKNRGAFLTETVSANTAVKNATGKRKTSEAKEKWDSENKVEEIQNKSSTSSERKENKDIRSKPSTSGMYRSEKQISQLPRIPRLSDKAAGSIKEKVEDLVSKVEATCSIAGKAEKEVPMEIETECSETRIVTRSSLKVSSTAPVRRKSVHFKDDKELLQIFEIPKEHSQGLHPVGHVKDAPPPRRPYNQQQLISSLPVEEYIHTVVSWNINWLEEQKNVGASQPPPVHENPLIPMLSSFMSYTDYHRVVTPLLYLELWARISKDYEMSCRSKQYILVGLDKATHLPPFSPRNKQLMMLHCHAAVTNEDMAKNNLPRYGDLVIFELGLESTNKTDDMEQCLSQGSGNRNYFATIFAYVCNVSRETITGATHFHKELLSTVSRPAAYKLSLTLWTRSRGYTMKMQKPMRMKVISYIRSDLRLFQALNYLPSSPLCKHILEPMKQDFSLQEVKRKTFAPLIKEEVLNDSQKQAILKITHACLMGETKICMIQGPPGTGKSHVIVNIIMQLLYGQNNYLMQRRRKNFPRILLCAPSNAAVDELVLRLLHIRHKIEKTGRFKMVRIGNLDTMNHKVREISAQELAKKDVKKSLQMRSDIESVEVEINHCKAKLNSLEQAKVKNMNKIREIQMKLLQLQRNTPLTIDDKEMKRMEKNAELKIVNGADIVATTLGSCFNGTMESLFSPDQNGVVPRCAFSCCIIDEATQSQELETLIPLMLGVTTLVLVGDAQQLPATILSVKAKEFGLYKSLFARIQECFEDARRNPVQFLDVQYRMHPEICLWPNRYFYNGKLHTPSNFTSQRSCALVPYCILSLEYIQNSRSMPANHGEAQLIKELTVGILDKVGRSLSVGIITPYNNQRKMIQHLLPADLQPVVEVNTIDSFQGQERDIIIISVGRTAGVGFLADSQRLNVALTRARCSLILCGNFSSLKNDFTWKMLLKNAEERQVLKHVPAAIAENRDELMRLVVKQ